MPSKVFIPPVQLLIAAALMWLIRTYLPFGLLRGAWQFPAALALGIVGSGLILICGVAFLRARTTVHPTHPEETSALLIDGLYCVSRNPMYLGLLLILLAWGVHLGSLPAFVPALLFVGYITKYQIVYEELALEKNFGDVYRQYKAKVRRWI